MRKSQIAIRTLFKKGRNNIIKIISLGIGLAVGLVLIASVFFEMSYDNFYPDGERIYQIQSNFAHQGNDMMEFGQVSGAIAPGMKNEISEIELATRFTYLAFDLAFFTEDKSKYSGNFIMADEYWFDMFPRPILVGDAKDILSRPMYALVSRKMAERMGGVNQVVGKSIEAHNVPERIITIGGVFEDIPENSHIRYDVLVSLSSISNFSYDGRDNWIGNDRYRGYVKLFPGVKPDELAPAIRRMQEKNQPMEELAKSGVKLMYTLKPLYDLHAGSKEAKRMLSLLSLLAFALIFTAVMNYILVVISSLVSRSREMAVNKCYGATDKDIYSTMLWETFIHLIVALILAASLILIFRGTIVDLLGTSIGALFSWQGCILLFSVCVLVFLVSGMVPGYLFAHIPVSSAFRNYNESRRYWKLGLLFVQFIAAGFLITLVVLIGKQYTFMVDEYPGYSYENLAYSQMSGVNTELRQKIVEEVSRLPEVAAVSTCTELPIGGPSGNNISLPNDDRELFNIADFYNVGNGYFDLMEIPVIDGRSFLENVSSSHDIMVSRSFVEKMADYTDWSDGAIGKSVTISEHSDNPTDLFTICGVYEDFRIGVIGKSDVRPSIMFYRSSPSGYLLVKYHQQTPESNARVEALLKELMPDKDVMLYSYATEMVSAYNDSRHFRDAVLIGGIVALLISLIGLMGYTNDEMNRRRKETAIRKVNGATIWNILSLFIIDIIRIALPALILAGGIAAYIGNIWLQQFEEKIPLSIVFYFFCGFLVLVIILAVVSLNSYRAASANPAENVKAE